MKRRWAVTLRLGPNETLETRLASIVEYLESSLGRVSWQLSDLDATGPRGDELTQMLNQKGQLNISSADLLRMLREPGQVIELDAQWLREGERIVQLIVRDGTSVDVLGAADIDLSATVLGDHVSQDPTLFRW
jgi:hypothetical protein